MWKCVECGEAHEDQFDNCWKCGASKKELLPAEPKVLREAKKSTTRKGGMMENKKILNNFFAVSPTEKKYPALRIISGIYQILAWIFGIGVFLSGIIAGGAQKNYRGSITSTGIITIVISIVAGTLLLIGLLAVAEIIKLFIDVEENTRSTKKILETKINA